MIEKFFQLFHKYRRIYIVTIENGGRMENAGCFYGRGRAFRKSKALKRKLKDETISIETWIVGKGIYDFEEVKGKAQ